MRRRVLSFGVVAALLAACPDPEREDRPPAPAERAAAAIDAGPPAPLPELEVSARYQLPDAGWAEIPFSDQGLAEIEPTDRLEVHTNLGLVNYRVRLFDEVDRAMESDDELEDDLDGLTYRIALPSPLKRGHRYTLSLDAQTGSAIVDASGRNHPDQRLEFKVAGEKEKPAPKRKPARRRR